MARAGKPFKVDTEPTKEVVVRSLTRDATVKACIFDLVDNAIDAARDTIYQSSESSEQHELPESYEGFEITLTLSGDGLKIEDNCGGISVDALKTMVMRFGKPSSHEMGIGAFGVGLNRALFKLGRLSHLRTDTGEQRAELVLDIDEYLKSENWDLPAAEFKSTGVAGTEIEIRKAPEDIAQQFADKAWLQELRGEMGRRYGRFVAKKLSIVVNGVRIKNAEIPIREGGPYESEHKYYKTENGVSVFIEYGQHRDHRFSKEPDHDLKRNSALTGEFGWTVLCNDRAILIADTSDRTGWDSYHTEFHGFVGHVSFVGPDPGLLPWDTTKTEIDLNNPAYRLALKDMRNFVRKWKAFAEERKKPGQLPKPVPPKKPSGPGGSGALTKPTPPPKKPPTKKPSVTKPDHNNFRTVLPTDVNEQNCFDKHLKLVHEAKSLDLAELTYSGMALMRMLFETSAITHAARHETLADMKEFAVARRKGKGVRMTPDDEKRAVPSLDEIISYMDNNPTVWGGIETYLKHSLKRVATHLPMLNGAVHNPFQTVASPKAFEIRDDMLPLLRHLIET